MSEKAEVATVERIPVDLTADALDIEVAKKAIENVVELMRAIMKPKLHYGIIPGTKKNSLYQAGADLINFKFQLRPEFKEISVVRNERVISYAVECSLVHRPTDIVISTGRGSCNTLEQRYVETIRTRNRVAAGKQKASISHWELDNVVYKMAQKRAKLAAVINGIPISHLFSQDVDQVLDNVESESEVVADFPEKKEEKKEMISEAAIDQIKDLWAATKQNDQVLYERIKTKYGASLLSDLTVDQASFIIKKLQESEASNGS